MRMRSSTRTTEQYFAPLTASSGSQQNGMLERGARDGHLNIIRDHTTAFKNRLEIEVELPDGMIQASGFAAWYRPAPNGVNWNVGVYIRDMPSADRALYNTYLKSLGAADPESAVGDQ